MISAVRPRASRKELYDKPRLLAMSTFSPRAAATSSVYLHGGGGDAVYGDPISFRTRCKHEERGGKHNPAKGWVQTKTCWWVKRGEVLTAPVPPLPLRMHS